MAQSELAYDVDVIVVGAGNAALCAALSARENGAKVVVLEKAPASRQGGNCPFTGGGFRFVHEGIKDVRSLVPDLSDDQVANVEMEPYTAEDFRNHMLAVTHSETDLDLMETLISQSRPTVEWMRVKGVTWELPIKIGYLSRAPSVIPSRVALSAWRSGQGLVQMLTTSARRNGIDTLYETEMTKLLQKSDGRLYGIIVRDADGDHEIHAENVVLACGGFQANAQMRRKYLGSGWENAKVRGSKYNTGDGHRMAIELGAQLSGQWDGCHATPVDADAPATGDLALTDRMPRRSYPLGITVNLMGLRFVDEGESFAEQTFVKVGRRILEQKGSIAFQIFDSKSISLLEARYGVSKAVEADTIHELAEKIQVDSGALVTTIDTFNAEAHEGEYKLRELDERSTRSLDPPKSNWAIKIDKPPFVAHRVTGGITYTYGGLKINNHAQVLDMEDNPITGLFAAGEIVGGIFYHGSLRAAGLMHGAVFGRLAGAGAATGI